VAGDPDPLPNTVTVSAVVAAVPSAGFAGGNVITPDAGSVLSHTVNLFQPSVDLTKAANRTTAAVGDTIVYTYTVDNNGSSDSPALVIDSLVDDNGTPGNAADDLSIANGKITFVGGDANNDGKLDLSEVWTYTASRVVLASDSDPLVNTAVV